MSLKIDAHLTDPNGIKEVATKTQPGMAHFAGSGPLGKTCKQCAEFEMQPRSVKNGRCRKWKRLMSSPTAGPQFPAATASCKYFEAVRK